MKDMLASVIHILPLTHVRRERTLPVPGKILVRKGQKVAANDVMAETRLNPNHKILDVAAGLAVPRSQVEQYIRVKPGDQLVEGDLVAGPVGLGRRVLRASGKSRVILVGSDQLLLEMAEGSIQLKAGITGEIVELITDFGVVIETTGSLIQGIWGNDRIDYGVLTILANEADQILLPDQLDESLRGAVVLAAHCDSSIILHKVGELSVRGLILASMSINLLPVAMQMNYPIILLEGFGDMGMNKLAFKLLTTSARREVSVNAQQRDIHRGIRPEIVIPLPMENVIPHPVEAAYFAPNLPVRSVRPPTAGKTGRIVRLSGEVVFPTGIRLQGAEILFDDGEIGILPLDNLEVFA